MTDQDLLRSYADRSDEDCLGMFIARYQGSLLRFISKFLGDTEVAQDIVQETFLQVARRPRQLLKVKNCHSWLLRVARNIGIDYLRRRRTARKHAGDLASHVAGTTAAREENAGPTASLECAETRQQVRAAIDGLKPRFRDLLLLKVMEEKSYREIAEITGLSVTNVGYLLHQAMKSLSFRLQGQKEDLL